MEEQTAQISGNHKRKKIAIVIFAIILIAGVMAGYFYKQYRKTHITTDDAFIEGNIHMISTKINGTVKNIHVRSNQFVKKGELLVELDPSDYDVKVKETMSAMNAEKAKLAAIDAKIESAKKQIAELNARANAIKGYHDSQEANMEQAEKDLKRMEDLYREDLISKEKYERTLTAYKSSRAMEKASSEGLRYGRLSAETQISVLKQAEAEKIVLLSGIQQKEALWEAEKLNYDYTKIYAPAEGYVTKKSVEVGNQLHAGKPIMAVVSLDDVYVVANYKETQLERVKQGQKVTIRVDTYPDREFKGEVESIMAGTGAAFSLFPPENATGNFVKVVQRIPVKIIFDKETDPEHVLRVGMSVVPTIVVE